jgi:hypothetical protein
MVTGRGEVLATADQVCIRSQSAGVLAVASGLIGRWR